MNDQPVGRLERVDLRTVWTTEAGDFTPWLARPENLEVLAETLGMDLELEATEKPVGPFRADIICRDGTNAWVLVENQLERTNHNHLGQLLTYAAGLQAVTIVWIAAPFTDEHRATLDWLNKITDESFRFFGLEVELWRIGNSLAAPKFNVVSKPNDWSLSVAKAARVIDDDADLSETRKKQKAYWTAFLNQVLGMDSWPFDKNRKPATRAWLTFPIGRTGFNLAAVMILPKNRIRVELYLREDNAKAFFGLLREQKDAIEQELQYPLGWEELPARQDSRIAYYQDTVNLEDCSDWPQQHEWLAKRLKEFHGVFAQRVKELDADDWRQ